MIAPLNRQLREHRLAGSQYWTQTTLEQTHMWNRSPDGMALETHAGSIVRCRVVTDDGTGPVTVFCADCDAPIECDVLGPTATQSFAPDDEVVVVHPRSAEERGVIVGRVAVRRGPLAAPPDAPEEIPDELVLEARKSLTLRVGSGSITIREDGKILIKGKDLVSHAQRLNRIKGGAVAIN
jgi:hypothetical protein